MSNALADQRDLLKNALEAAGFNAYSTKPDQATTPLVFVGPDDPYITRDGATLAGELVHHQVILVGDVGVNETRANELDQMILDALHVIDDLQGFAVDQVRNAGQMLLNGQSCLAVPIAVISEIYP